MSEPSLMRPYTLRQCCELVMRAADAETRVKMMNDLLDVYEKQEAALRNCLALARAKERREDRPGSWEDIVRFCASAGIVPTVLRTEEP